MRLVPTVMLTYELVGKLIHAVGLPSFALEMDRAESACRSTRGLTRA